MKRGCSPIFRALAVFLALALLAGCGESTSTTGTGPGTGTAGTGGTGGTPSEPGARLKLVIYTSHGKEHFGPCLERFKKAHPEIEVTAPIDLGATQLALRIRGETSNPQCDVWWGGPHYDFIDAERRGLLQPYKPTWADHCAADRRSPTAGWYGQFITPEVIMYNTNKLKPEEAPQDWDDLLKPQWKDKIVLRNPPPSGTMKAIFAAMIWRAAGNSSTGPTEPGFDWLRKLDDNTAHYAHDPGEMYQYLSTGSTPVTLWNMADVYIQREVNKYPFGMVVPKSGVPVLVEGIAIVRGAPNAEAARIFYEFITAPEEMIFQANELHRIPARDDLPKDKLPEWMTAHEIKALPIDWVDLAPKATEWMDTWNRTIRTAK